jgi:hypothetical protein
MVSERLHDLPERETGDLGDLARVEAQLNAPARQDGAGLRATFVLANANAGPVQLVNPVDLLQWQLLDASGAPLVLPSRPSNLRIHRPASAPWELNRAVPIVEVSRAGARADAAVLDTPSVGLESRDELAVTFEFGHILEDGSARELPSGDYRLACTATLIDAIETQRSRILRCEPLGIRFDRG